MAFTARTTEPVARLKVLFLFFAEFLALLLSTPLGVQDMHWLLNVAIPGDLSTSITYMLRLFGFLAAGLALLLSIVPIRVQRVGRYLVLLLICLNAALALTAYRYPAVLPLLERWVPTYWGYPYIGTAALPG